MTKTTTDETGEDAPTASRDALEGRVDTALADVYRALGTLYLEAPTSRTVEPIVEWCRLVADDPDLPEKVADAVAAVLEASADPDALRPAFTRLFMGISETKSPPPPYESLYVDGVLNGRSSPELEAFYLDAGFELAVDDELVDHAGYELAFLGALCERGDRERQLVFIERFVGDWLPAFHDAAREADAPAFYHAVFDLTEALLDLHLEALEEAEVVIR